MKTNHKNIFRTSGGPVYARLLSRINRANISVSEREGRKSWKLGLEFPLSYKLALGQMWYFIERLRIDLSVLHNNIFDAQIYYYCKQVVVSTLFWKQFKKFHNFFFWILLFEHCKKFKILFLFMKNYQTVLSLSLNQSFTGISQIRNNTSSFKKMFNTKSWQLQAVSHWQPAFMDVQTWGYKNPRPTFTLWLFGLRAYRA